MTLSALDTPYKVSDFASVDRAALEVVCLPEHALKFGLEMLPLSGLTHPETQDVPDNFTSLLKREHLLVGSQVKLLPCLGCELLQLSVKCLIAIE